MKKKLYICIVSILTILIIGVSITQIIKLNKIEKTIKFTFTNELKTFVLIDFSKITENKKAYNIALSSISKAYSISSLIDDGIIEYDDQAPSESLNILIFRLHDSILNYDTSILEKLSQKENIELLNELIKNPLDKNTIKTTYHNIFK